MKIGFYIGVFKLPNQSKQSAKYSIQKISFLICRLIGRLNGESIFRLSSNNCNYLKYKGKAGEEAGEARMAERL